MVMMGIQVVWAAVYLVTYADANVSTGRPLNDGPAVRFDDKSGSDSKNDMIQGGKRFQVWYRTDNLSDHPARQCHRKLRHGLRRSHVAHDRNEINVSVIEVCVLSLVTTYFPGR